MLTRLSVRKKEGSAVPAEQHVHHEDDFLLNQKPIKQKKLRLGRTVAIGLLTGVPISAGVVFGVRISDESTVYNMRYQAGETFKTSGSSLEVQLIATPQKIPGYTSYLLNGLGNNNQWYQIGLTYEDNYKGSTGYVVSSEAFAVHGHNLSQRYPPPSTHQGAEFWKPVSGIKSGDKIKIILQIENHRILALVEDSRTGEHVGYQGHTSSSRFLGINTPSTSAGTFSGLMTEMVTSGNLPSNPASVTYHIPGYEKPGYIWVTKGHDEGTYVKELGRSTAQIGSRSVYAVYNSGLFVRYSSGTLYTGMPYITKNEIKRAPGAAELVSLYRP